MKMFWTLTCTLSGETSLENMMKNPSHCIKGFDESIGSKDLKNMLQESGYGLVDILMTPKSKNKPGIIMEMK